MDPILGMTPTGRRIPGPASDLIELQSPKGLKHTAIAYHGVYQGHPALKADTKAFGRFMQAPGVTGLVELTESEEEQGLYLYPTGTVWSVAEVVRAYADLGETCGVRAGLELAYVAAQILQEAAEAAEEHELYNHGSLDPWRLLLRPDGQVVVLGYGLPQVEILDFLEDDKLLPKEDAFRYAPPERLEDEGEDLDSDLFSLALVALELMTGRPVYDGLINDIRQQATRAEGTYRLYKWRNLLPDPVREVLGRALKYDPDARYPSATDFVYAVHDLLGSPDLDGPSLHEVVKRVKMAEQRGKPLVGGRTAALTREELAHLASEMDDDDDAYVLAPPTRPRPDAEEEDSGDEEEEHVQRWGKATRSGRRSVVDVQAERRAAATERGKAKAPKAKRQRRKEDLRKRLRRDRPSRREAGGPEGASDKESLRASLRRSSGGRPRSRRETEAEAEAPPAEPAPSPPAPAAPEAEEEVATSGGAAALLARLRSSAGRRSSLPPESSASSSDPAPDPTPAAPAAPASESTPAASRPSEGRRDRGTRGDRGRDERITIEISVDGSRSKRTRLRLGDPLSESAWRLAQVLTVMPMDLTGRLTGWFRLEQDGHWWPGDDTAEVLDPARPVTLVRVPNRVARVTFEVEGPSPPIRFQAPVGTAVPASALLAHLCRFLELSGEGWGLYVDDRKLDPFQILDDFQPEEGLEVVVKR